MLGHAAELGDDMLAGLEGFTFLHIVISLVAIASGLIVAGGFLSGTDLRKTTSIFLIATVLTSVTGLLFPFNGFLPSHLFAIVSLVVLAVAVYAYYGKRMSGGWRRIFVITSVLALYLNVFVLVVQTFTKNPALLALAPTQSELPFALAQGLTLLAFLAVGIGAVKRFDA